MSANLSGANLEAANLKVNEKFMSHDTGNVCVF
jgi:uncharacterized protein YjbI with pentapeptide repeats